MSGAHGAGGSAARTGLAAHVVHEVRPARLERQWSAISTRFEKRHGYGRVGGWAAAVLLAFVIGVLVRPSSTSAPSWEGTIIDSTAATTVRLPDGAEALVGAGTRLRVGAWDAARAMLALERGEVTLDVPKQAGRTWAVSAGPYDVRVVGTRFLVRIEPSAAGERVYVEVQRGRVEVHQREGGAPPRSLGAGESWSGETTAQPTAAGTTGSNVEAAAATASAIASAEPSAAASAPAASSAPAPSATAAVAPSATASVAALPQAPSWEDHAKARRYREAYDTLGADGFARAVDTASAEKLFRLAEVARASGHPRDAERAYDTVRKRHRSDARAALAAFELGRLRLDSLKNPSGAAEALSDAIALAPGAPFREDAEARRVQALHASGATAACIKARDAYLARYPSGAHAAVVRLRCGSP